MNNLIVVELASVLAGPSVGQFFQELGARVIKIENKKTGGDMTRRWKNPLETHHKNVSAYYAAVNYGKEHHFFDFKVEEDYQKCIGLIKQADIVITNFKAGDAKKFRLDFETIKSLNHHIIYGAIHGFGRDQPRVAFDIILQAEAGYMSMTGFENKPFAKMPVAVIDLFAAHQLKEGILVALLNKETVNKPQLVEVSLLETAIASLANQASNWLTSGYLPKSMGSLHPNIAPYGEIIYTLDNVPIILAIGTDKQFYSLAKYMDLSEANTEAFATNELRVPNRKRLLKILQEHSANILSTDLLHFAHSNSIPLAKIKNIKEVFEDPDNLKLILTDQQEGVVLKRVKTTVFRITT